MNPSGSSLKLPKADARHDSSNSEGYEESEESQSPTPTLAKTHAVFVSKLYSMLHDPDVQNLISWSDAGDIIPISNPSRFSQHVLPRYFKHSNWQSFVRQLNMYGFNKVNDIVHSTLRQESQAWEFRHAHFKRGSVEELAKIKRKSVRSMRSTAPLHVEDDYHYYPDRLCQDMSLRVAQITQNYQNLRNNLVYIRQVVQSQQTIIGSMLSILGASLAPPSSSSANTATTTQFYPNMPITSSFERLVDLERRFRSLEEYTQTFMTSSPHTQKHHTLPINLAAPVASSSTHIASTSHMQSPEQSHLNEQEKYADSTVMRLGTGSHLLNPTNSDPTKHP